MTAAEPRPIVLIGLMLSGKSTVGEALASHLGWAFVDLDDAIVTRTARSVPDWFAEGEAAFRAVERDILAAVLAERGPRVIATGGGAMQDARSRRECRARAFVVYLEATPAELVARLSGPSGRPLLDGGVDPAAVLEQLLAERQANYVSAQHLRLPARESVAALVTQIVEAYGEHPPH